VRLFALPLPVTRSSFFRIIWHFFITTFPFLLPSQISLPKVYHYQFLVFTQGRCYLSSVITVSPQHKGLAMQVITATASPRENAKIKDLTPTLDIET
jgi:hypothetical protein